MQASRDRKKAYDASRREGQDGFLRDLALTAKDNARLRGARNRNDFSHECEIEEKDVVKLWDGQDGKCHYTGLQLQFDRSQPWVPSIERLDNKKGYVLDNVVLIASELNGVVSWTPGKLLAIRALQQMPVDLQKLENRISLAKAAEVNRRPNGKRQKIVVDGQDMFVCTQCKKTLPRESFSKDKAKMFGIRSSCSECDDEAIERRLNSFGGYLRHRLNSTFSSSKTRSTRKRPRNGSGQGDVPELTLDDVCAKLIEQQGRCFYSGVPMVFTPKSPWMMSIERINTSKTYTVENTVLICWEFNTVKPWTRGMVEEMLLSLEEKHKSQPALIEDDAHA
jgi:hypothetical protein